MYKDETDQRYEGQKSVQQSEVVGKLILDQLTICIEGKQLLNVINFLNKIDSEYILKHNVDVYVDQFEIIAALKEGLDCSLHRQLIEGGIFCQRAT